MRERGAVSTPVAWGILAVLLIVAAVAGMAGWLPAEMNPW